MYDITITIESSQDTCEGIYWELERQGYAQLDRWPTGSISQWRRRSEDVPSGTAIGNIIAHAFDVKAELTIATRRVS